MKNDLMIHKKKKHTEKVQDCWNHVQGCCGFDDEHCWFIHSDESSANSEVKEFKCKPCGIILYDLNNILLHKKKEHKQTVQQCRNGESCSYKH